jgi:hypothetical protein
LFAITPFEEGFTGGVYVAAGDLTGDGRAELIITPDEGGGPRARVFSAGSFTQIADFFGIEDTNFRGGARAAVGDVNGDGRGDLIVAAGFGGGPRIAVFDGAQLTATGGPKLFGDFAAFEDTLRNGVYVAVGDVNGDGFAEILAGGGPGGGPRISVFDGLQLLQGRLVRNADFFAGDDSNRGGVRIAMKNLDNDGLADLVVGAGTDAGSGVLSYRGSQLFGSNPPIGLNFQATPGFLGGVFVG